MKPRTLKHINVLAITLFLALKSTEVWSQPNVKRIEITNPVDNKRAELMEIPYAIFLEKFNWVSGRSLIAFKTGLVNPLKYKID